MIITSIYFYYKINKYRVTIKVIDWSNKYSRVKNQIYCSFYHWFVPFFIHLSFFVSCFRCLSLQENNVFYLICLSMCFFFLSLSISIKVAVAVAFFLCWAPFHAQRLMAVYGKTSRPKSDLFRHIYTALTYISGVLYFMSTCINPLLYSIMSHKFRNAFKVIKIHQNNIAS